MLLNLTPPTAGYRGTGYPSAVVSAAWDAVLRWWDGVELWLTQLGLALQVALLMLVLLPACWWAARVLDRCVGALFGRLEHRDAEDAQESR